MSHIRGHLVNKGYVNVELFKRWQIRIAETQKKKGVGRVIDTSVWAFISKLKNCSKDDEPPVLPFFFSSSWLIYRPKGALWLAPSTLSSKGKKKKGNYFRKTKRSLLPLKRARSTSRSKAAGRRSNFMSCPLFVTPFKATPIERRRRKMVFSLSLSLFFWWRRAGEKTIGALLMVLIAPAAGRREAPSQHCSSSEPDD